MGPAGLGEGVDEGVEGDGILAAELVEGEGGVGEAVAFGVEVDEGGGEPGARGLASFDDAGVQGLGFWEVLDFC